MTKSAGDDQGAPDKNRQIGACAEEDEIDDLRDDKEQRDIDAEQLAEIPRRRIHRHAISEKNRRAQRENSNPRRCARSVETLAHDSVAAGFESRGNCKDEIGEGWIHRIPPFVQISVRDASCLNRDPE